MAKKVYSYRPADAHKDYEDRFESKVPYKAFVLSRDTQTFWTIEQDDRPATVTGIAGMFTSPDKCRQAIDAYLNKTNATETERTGA